MTTTTEMAMSEYLVMSSNGDGMQDEHEVDWRDLGVYGAANQRAAIKQAMQAVGLEEGSFRAIPNGSTRVHTVTLERHANWTVA
jgi:hypothetical protein